MIDRIELSVVDIRGPAQKLLWEVDEYLDYLGRSPSSIPLYTHQKESFCRAIRGAIRRAGKPSCMTWREWNDWLMEEAANALPWTYKGVRIG